MILKQFLDGCFVHENISLYTKMDDYIGTEEARRIYLYANSGLLHSCVLAWHVFVDADYNVRVCVHVNWEGESIYDHD